MRSVVFSSSLGSSKKEALVADRGVGVWSGERFVIRLEHKPE
jgi:hypothetical protein